MRPGPDDEMRARVEIDGLTYPLPRGTDVAALRERIEAAARAEPTFVSFATSDGLASVLVHPTSRVFLFQVKASDEGASPQTSADCRIGTSERRGEPPWDQEVNSSMTSSPRAFSRSIM